MAETNYSLKQRGDLDEFEVHGPGMYRPEFGPTIMREAGWLAASEWQRRHVVRMLQRAYEAGKADRSAEIAALLKG